MSRAFEIARTIMDAAPMQQVFAMFPRDEELNELVDDQVIRGATRVFIADAAIPEEIVRLTGNFVADYQTKVPSPDILTRTAFRGTPNPDDLLEGDVIYFRRQGAFRHRTGWDRVVLLGKWDEFLITAERAYHQK